MSGLLADAVRLWASGWKHRRNRRGEKSSRKPSPLSRPLRLEPMEERALLSASVAANDTGKLHATHDVARNALPASYAAPLNAAAATVTSRHVFYNNSYYDAAARGKGDDDAIAADKTALLPGQTATFANYTSYSRGINGIMVDIDGAAGAISATDFEFKVGNGDDPSSWTTAPLPTVSSRLLSDGHTTRVTLTWADNAIQKEWLQVNVLATASTALESPDVFYFGNAIGDSGDSAVDGFVSSADAIAAASHTQVFKRAAVTNQYDYNRDGMVNATDSVLAGSNATGSGNALQLITPADNQPLSDIAASNAVDTVSADLPTASPAVACSTSAEIVTASGSDSVSYNAIVDDGAAQAIALDAGTAPVELAPAAFVAPVDATGASVIAPIANIPLVECSATFDSSGDVATELTTTAQTSYAAPLAVLPLPTMADATLPTITATTAAAVHSWPSNPTPQIAVGNIAAVEQTPTPLTPPAATTAFGNTRQLNASVDSQRYVQLLMAALSDSSDDGILVIAGSSTQTTAVADAVFESIGRASLL